MKIIIAGSRDFDNFLTLRDKLDFFLQNVKEEIQIVSGGARGADKMGETYSKLRGYGLKIFKADWNKYGKKAGYLRNEEMAKYGTHCVCFWDGKSKGTKHMIDLAKQYQLNLRVVKV